MIASWPDPEEALLRRYVAVLRYNSWKPIESVLRRFQRFVTVHSPTQPLAQSTLEAWVRACVDQSTLRMAVKRTQIVTRFLDWLVSSGHIPINPLAGLRQGCQRHSTAAVVRALASPNPEATLEKLRGLTRFGSHLGPVIQEHVERMQTLGFRYHEYRFRRFDEFLQKRPGAPDEPLSVLVHEYATRASSPAGHMERVKVGRAVAASLRRTDPGTPTPHRDRMIAREVPLQRVKPYIFSTDEIQQLLKAAREFPSPNAPLRPATLYTIFVLAYTAGLRIGEVVALQLGDIRHEDASIDIRDTKFFKSRRLPLSASGMVALERYEKARWEAGGPLLPESPLFWHERGGYAYHTVNHLMRRVLRHAGLKKEPGRHGPRIHDLRHRADFLIMPTSHTGAVQEALEVCGDSA